MTDLQKTNKPGFYKDSRTNMVQNLNWEQERAYKVARAQFIETADLRCKYDKLAGDMDELKELLRRALTAGVVNA